MPTRLLTTAEVAEMLAMSPEWVREHAGELGAFRLGDGPAGHLRFEEARVAEALERRRLPSPPEPRRPARRPGPRPKPPGDVELLQLPKWAE